MSSPDVVRSTPALERSVTESVSVEELMRPAARRREKAQLSCNACRRRKVRCDRLHPCSNCMSRGQASSCVYAHAVAVSRQMRHGSQVQERIDQLESLVRNLMQQSQQCVTSLGENEEREAPAEGSAHRPSELPSAAGAHISGDASPSPSVFGSLKIEEAGASYVSSAHWAAALDSIAELRDHFQQKDETYVLTSETVQLPASFPRPQLLYGGCSVYVTPAAIFDALPSRLIVDRLVSRYFSDLDMASGIPHSGKFLREYEAFWKAPQAAPIVWVGLLFSIMCLSAQFQQAFLGPDNTLIPGRSPQPLAESQRTIELYREKTIQCLVLGHYTQGGPFVLETLSLYLIGEVFLAKEIEVGIWVLVGNIVQLAIYSGYHRDAEHFANVTPFAREMRRRVWALIVQTDFGVSSQLGLPRLVKASQSDTAEPRNLADSDFDEFSAALPPPRPENDITPILYTLAKLRLLSVAGRIADAVSEVRPCSWDQAATLDRQLDAARAALPSSMQWQGLVACMTASPQNIIQRIWLQLSFLRQKIVLYKRFLVASRLEPQYGPARSKCAAAAMEVLELQRLIDDETQVDGRLYQSRWRVSFAFMHDFLLAASTLCFCLQVHNEMAGGAGGVDAGDESDRMRMLMRASRSIWLRDGSSSKEAQRAVAVLSYVLQEPGPEYESAPSADGPSVLNFPDLMSDYDFQGLGGLESANAEQTWQFFGQTMDASGEAWSVAQPTSMDRSL